MKADYKNWVPKYMVNGLIAGTIVFAVLFVIFGVIGLGLSGVLRWIIFAALLIALIGIGMFLKWSVMAYKAFSYDGTRQLSKQIIEGTANYINIPNGGKCLDVGCGSGALTIACAKRNPKAEIVGLDRWGKEYSNFSNMLCCKNAKAEAIGDQAFQKILGDIKPGVTELTIAAKLDYYMRELGAEGNSFDTIVASGFHSAMPHAVPTAKKLEKGL